eukprot:CAMPEP_0114229988 /NCGR_PEP_ID=MMETSP0058-20121206/3219_1 /TAXON_ID=36894 /ORGANISM="Pyramimonas parkeae, CCMP726" /LENGTH=75 /DNA_ID=CAMNT_0001341137 /DNA_START=1059 /DNA_END=1284 /DNA_ORIENTATION=+
MDLNLSSGLGAFNFDVADGDAHGAWVARVLGWKAAETPPAPGCGWQSRGESLPAASAAGGANCLLQQSLTGHCVE